MKNFYYKKKILITGNTGFKGSWLTQVLLKFGAKIIGYSDTENRTEPNLYKILKLNKKIKFVKGEIENLKLLSKVFKTYKPEIVFHLAAQPIVSVSYKYPHKTIGTNVLGSLNVLEICRKVNFVKTLIYVTSDKCYENLESIYGYRENDKLGGRDPYSASKAAAENLFYAYNNSFFKNKFGAASVRAGNVIGGGDWSVDRLIPDFVRAKKSQKAFHIRNPKSVRPWQHVLDPIFGYLKLAKYIYYNKKKYTGSWNFGPNFEKNLSTLDLVSILNKKVFPKIKIKKTKADRKSYEAKILRLNCDKAINLLNWKPVLNTEQSLIFTIDWYNDYLSKKNIIKTTNDQISFYIKNLKNI